MRLDPRRALPPRCEDRVVDPQGHHLGRIATQDSGGARVDVDVGALVRRLILFERCTVESIRLIEIPALVAAFGVDGLLELLDSGAVRLICDAMTAGQIGQTAGLRATVKRGAPLPLGSYRLTPIGIADRRAFLHSALQEVHKANISFRAVKSLKAALAPRLLDYPSSAVEAGVRDAELEIRQENPVVWSAIRAAVRKETGLDPGSDPEFRVNSLGQEGDFRIVTTMGATLGLPPDQEHGLVESAILALAGLDQRIHLMESFGAVSGFRDDQAALFEQKLSFALSLLDPTSQERRFDRVVTLAGLPGLEALPPGTRIDVHRLLRLRESGECRELRAWLRGVDSETDARIDARFGDVRDELAAVTHSPLGRTVRFLTATGVGFVPIVGPLIGIVVSAADTFLLDRVLGKPGPAAFLGRHYPSIFLKNETEASVAEGDRSPR